MKPYRLTFFISAIISIYWLLPISPAVLADCDKCEALPPDCEPGHATPFSGGPTCSCTSSHQPQGCILKPCDHVTDDSLCECSSSTGSVKNRQFCRKYQCTGESGHCQSCNDLPADCTMNSYNNSPASGGPECSCANQMAPGGCTLKPCVQGNLTSDPCVSKAGGVSSVVLYGTTCPGNLNYSSFSSGGGGGKNVRTSVAGWVLVAVSGVLLTLAIVVFRLSRAFLVRDHLMYGISKIFAVIALIHLVIAVVFLVIGLLLVFI